MEEVIIARLPTISLRKLLEKDWGESQRLQDVFKTHGFTYLSLDGVGTMLEDWASVLSIMARYFCQPLDVKLQDDCKSDTFGYEPVGTSAGVHPHELDYYESFKVARFEINSPDPLKSSVARNNTALFQRFMSSAHLTLITILERLSDACQLEGDNRFECFHRDDRLSRSSLALFHYPKQSEADAGAGHNKHTDLGTLTFLLCEQWGLQVLCPEEGGNQKGSWAYVAPKPGHAVVNVGDSLRFLSQMRFRSAVHRVVPVDEEPPKLAPSACSRTKQGTDRYSITYFLRPEDDVKYRDSLGRMFSAREWHDAKFDVFRQDHTLQEEDSFLTGGMEKAEAFVDSY